MDVLFVHQNFPGQYLHIARSLSKARHIRLTALTVEPQADQAISNLNLLRYGLDRANTPNIHPWALETETKVIRGEACARAAHQLALKGYKPNLICAHPGWGESLFLREIWPNTPILHYQEFFYNTHNSDLDFDSELQSNQTWENKAKASMKNAAIQLALEASSWNISPTNFQKSTFPSSWQDAISVIHDGIDANIAKPGPSNNELTISDSLKLRQGEPIVTFVNRTLEPYRGFHSFVRAIPEIQRLHPKAKIIIVGKTEGVSYGSACPNGEWKDYFLQEIDGMYDPSKVHFAGSLSYPQYLKLLQLSQAHVYLTYPFVLSWSCLEAMSTGCAVIGSSTAPVQEIIHDGHNGLLVDFFDYQAIANTIAKVLQDRELAETLGTNARATILKDYSIEKCLPRQIALMDMVSSGILRRK